MGWFTKKKARPDTSDAAIRAIVLRHVVSYAFMTPPRESVDQAKLWWTDSEKREFAADAERSREQHWNSLGSLKKHMSPWETAFSRSTTDSMSESQQMDASWRVEALTAILWALNVVAEMPPYDTQANPEMFGDFFSADPDSFAASAQLRSNEEIDHARDVAELWHWRSRTRQLIEDGTPFPSGPEMEAAGFTSFDGIVRVTADYAAKDGRLLETIDEDFAAFGKPYRDLSDEEWSQIRSITMERHFALNWLCGQAPRHRWDETPTDT